MNRRIVLFVVAIVLPIANVATAEILPRKGTFTGYYFTDRWGQGVFGIFFVKPELTEQLADSSWRPIAVTSNDIRQPLNPGAAMIHQIDKVARVDNPPLKITLALDHNSIPFGGQTKLRVKVANVSDQPIELFRRQFLLRTTIYNRGAHPDHEFNRDAIYDSFKNAYGFGIRSKSILRATMNDALFANSGDIQMRGGAPVILVDKDGKPKRAGVYDEDRPTIDATSSLEFVSSIGSGWLVNEYELQIHYRPREKTSVPYILSPPLSFDVVADN